MTRRRDSSPSTPQPVAAVVPAIRNGPLIPQLMTDPTAPMTRWGTNYDVTTPTGWAAVLGALKPADWIPSDGGEMFLDVVGWVCHPHEVTDRNTGEVKSVTRTVLVGKDGKTAAFASDFVPRTLAAAILSYPGEWPVGGMPCRCYTDKSRRQGASDYGCFEFRPDLLPAEESTL